MRRFPRGVDNGRVQPQARPILQRIASIAVARDPARLGLLVALRLAVGVVGLWVGITSAGEGTVGTALTIGGALVIGYAGILAIGLTSLRIEVFADQVHVTGPMLSYRFRLARGPIRRWPARQACPLGAWFGGFGVRIGDCADADVPRFVVVLDPRRPVLCLPTTSGELVVGVVDDGALLQALDAATRHASSPDR